MLIVCALAALFFLIWACVFVADHPMAAGPILEKWAPKLFRTQLNIKRNFGTTRYLDRFYVFGRMGRVCREWLPVNVYIHRISSSDADVFHNHPGWFLSIILSGGYVEVRRLKGEIYPTDRRWKRFTAGMVNIIGRNTFHYLTGISEERPCWTLVFTGPALGRKWGFLVRGKFNESSEARAKGSYFA
jgi:hypothetical protein